jgi:hypothetical protein
MYIFMCVYISSRCAGIEENMKVGLMMEADEAWCLFSPGCDLSFPSFVEVFFV